MSLQVFLQAYLTGSEQFLSLGNTSAFNSDAFLGRASWLNLYAEVLPRALLAELKLSPMLLGSSNAEQFLLVLAEEEVARANELLRQAAQAVGELSSNTLRLEWASTENLGSWPVARKRLDDAIALQRATPLAASGTARAFEAAAEEADPLSVADYFARFAGGQVTATAVGWNLHDPARLLWDGGQYLWPLKEQSDVEADGILFPRRIALDDDGGRAPLPELAARATGAPLWGILVGAVDQFEAHIKQAGTVEEHIQLSMLIRDFFAGELGLLGTLPDFWRKITVLYRGGDNFAVLGSWDALLALARELQRLFEKFAEHNLQAATGDEGKTISMSLALAPELDADCAAVFEQASSELQKGKATDAGTLRLFGRTLEWKRLAVAEELKTSLMRLVQEFGFSPDYIHDLASVYREAPQVRSGRKKTARTDKPWRTYMRLSAVVPQSRGKEINHVRTTVITSLIGKRTASLKLRPSGRVGLEWARLASDNRQ